jgi:hypothetical protein
VLKKILKAVTTLALLVGCYFGYVHVFAIVVERLRAVHRTENVMFPVPSNSKRVSIAHAEAAFGSDHWSTDPELAFRYYNAERGYWMYAKDWERIVEENGVRYDGKRMRLKPFAAIAKSRDGKKTQTITSDVAVIDLNEPLSFNVNPEGGPLKMKHAHLEPNVWIRDDKSTPTDPSDDLRIGPLTTVDYDEPTQQIKTESDTYVVIQDPDMVTTAYGMLVQLRKDETPRPAGSSGFEGAERLDLLRNVHFVMRDVGKSGFMPGSKQPRRAAKETAGAKDQPASGTDSEKGELPSPEEPTPLDIRCDSKMQVFLPKPRLPVSVGPPEPPAPTVVQFDRNVVVLRGQPNDRPDQLTCDTLKLDLVPGEKLPQDGMPEPTRSEKQAQPPSGQDSAEARSVASAGARAKTKTDTVAQIEPNSAGGAGADDEAGAGDASLSKPVSTPDATENKGLFGDLTLQRTHATGHAVWLYLPAEGVKLLCNELIDLRRAPFKPDLTYFRGDLTRLLDLEKIDVVQEEGPDKGKVTSVTRIRAEDATLFHKGKGLDMADVVANGPGRLETRPGRDQPVERVAIWQDKLFVQNEVGPDGKVLRKLVYLTGNRPCFMDQLQKTSVDSAQLIKVWLKPKPQPAPASQDEASLSASLAGTAGAGKRAAMPIALASTGQTSPRAPAAKDETPAEKGRSAQADTGGGLQMERLLAVRDVHLLAPSKTMTARQRLDAEFVAAPATSVAAPATSVAAAAPAKADGDSSSVAPKPEQVEEQEPGSAKSPEQLAASDQPEKKPAEPPAEPLMVGSAEQIWAMVELEPNPNRGQASNKQAADTKSASTTKTTTASTGRGSTETNAQIRKVWMWGNVALHQDPAQGKSRGQNASGEAFYLDNRGENKAISYVYQRDPTEKTRLPGPLPPAWVEDEDKTIKAAGIIQMNQETDQVWVEGPGTFVQLADSAPSAPTAAPAIAQDAGAHVAVSNPSRSVAHNATAKPRATSFVTQDVDRANRPAPEGQAFPSTSKTGAARPPREKVPTKIQFSERMEFSGRTTNPEGEPAGRADFYGIVTAQMQDALLYCQEKMIAYTDRPVPLAELGAMSKAKSQPKPGDNAADPANAAAGGDEADDQPKAQLALITCYRNAVGVTRKVDPDTRILLQKEWIEADDILTYDRRTGDFDVPRKGKVYLYDRSDNSSHAPALDPDGDTKKNPSLTPAERTVTPTSGRAPNRSNPTAGTAAATIRSTAPPPDANGPKELKTGEIPPLVLTQIYFQKGMRGRYEGGAETDTLKTRWSEFFGDVQLARAKVTNDRTAFNFDKLPGDALFLTGQTMRGISEPPPVGSPPSTPARDSFKAWEKAYFWSNDKSIQADWITYDSEKDLIYAFGEGERGVIYAQQHAAGQPSSLGSAKAVRLNPKTGATHLIDNASIQMIDKNTGVRPGPAAPIDPDAKPKKGPKKPFRVPSSNTERRGFTGQ